jgi:Lrp/AsnC family leucine-responsive transcriptional regulator
VTGEDWLLFDVHCSHAERLEQVVDSLARHGPVTTSLVLRSYPPKPLPGCTSPPPTPRTLEP